MKNKRQKLFLILGIVILFIPLIAMQFTEEVMWTWIDFVVAGTLLLGAGWACDLILRKVKNTKYRLAICLAILIVLVLLWAELAVGIFNSPIAGS